jgi:hypothetical protein
MEDFWHSQLCRHGPFHDRHDCNFAHSWAELRPPEERHHLYDQTWAIGGFDRWYGQTMTDAQMARIKRYFNHTLVHDIPVWCHGLMIISNNVEIHYGMSLPWDFGLTHDLEMLSYHRSGRKLPFTSMPHLWERLELRKAAIVKASS